MKKYCSKCGETKALGKFYLAVRRKHLDGHTVHCADCMKKVSKEWQKAYPKYNIAWKKTHPKYHAEYTAAWRAANIGRSNAYTSARRAAKLRATPPWVDLKEIEKIYIKASKRGLVVDHEIPLQGKGVRGLHVPWNLQLLTRKQNGKKGNRWKQPD